MLSSLAPGFGGGPLSPSFGGLGNAGAAISPPVAAAVAAASLIAAFPLEMLAGGPIAALGGVFSAGFPLGGPVTALFRGGGGPLPPTLFASLLTPAGPIGMFLIGTSGSPIGLPVFGFGGLPIAPIL